MTICLICIGPLFEGCPLPSSRNIMLNYEHYNIILLKPPWALYAGGMFRPAQRSSIMFKSVDCGDMCFGPKSWRSTESKNLFLVSLSLHLHAGYTVFIVLFSVSFLAGCHTTLKQNIFPPSSHYREMII